MTSARERVVTWRADARLDRRWHDALAALAPATLAHAPEWHVAIQQAYGHQPLYVGANDEEGRSGLLPAFIMRRPLFGAVVASMPFLDTGGPCAATPAIAQALVDRLIADARELGAVAVELRGMQRVDVAVPAMEHKVTLSLRLPSDADRLWRQIDRGVRNQIRKAQRAGLAIEFGGAELLADFYPVFAARMRDLGSPVHGRRFFDAIFAAFGSRARLAIVRKGEQAIGGLVAVACRDTLAVPWASCLHEFFALCPNMLLYWETLRRASADGFAKFDFGRSTRDSGTYRFKRQWGAVEEPLYWYSIPTAGRRHAAADDTSKTAALAGSWRRLPLTLTRRLGPHIRRYLTQ